MMHAEKTKKTGKKSIALAALVLVLVAAIAMGTVAWLNAHDTKENTFTVGDFKSPTTEPENPSQPIEEGKLTGHIYEKNWDETNAKLVPGNTILKDPNIGIGKGSEDSAVYVYVNNNLKATSKGHIYFKLNTAYWKAVDGEATPLDNTTIPDAKTGEEYYSGGMFEYIGGTGGKNVLTAKDADGWTGTLFDKVHTAEAADADSLKPENSPGDLSVQPTVTVQCFLHQISDGKGSEIPGNIILDAAKKAFKISPIV